MRPIHKVFTDAKLPTERQRQRLCKMLYRALLEMRILGWQNKPEQAADLADAFHNLPDSLWSEYFSFDFFRNFLQSYQNKYPAEGAKYLNMLNKINEEEFNF